MGQFNVQMPDGSVRSVQGTTLAAAINNAGAGASAPSSKPAPSSGSSSQSPSQNVPSPAPASSQYGAGQGYWSTINGPRTVPQMAAELAKVGYNGPTDPGSVMTAYARTAGGQVTADNANNLPGGAGPTPAAAAGQLVQTVQNPGGLTAQDKQDILNAFQQSSGFSLADLAEKKREFDATLQQQKDMWTLQGLPQLVIQQKAQALAEQEFQAQTALAQSNLGETYLKDAAALSGPADYFQEDDFLRGARQRADVPVFLQALRDNTQLPNGQAGGTPTPASMGNLADRLTGSVGLPSTTPGVITAQGSTATGSTVTNTGAALGTISGILAKGGGALAPQELEQLNPDELALVQSGANKLGYSMPAFLQQYQQSRVGQSSAQAA